MLLCPERFHVHTIVIENLLGRQGEGSIQTDIQINIVILTLFLLDET